MDFVNLMYQSIMHVFSSYCFYDIKLDFMLKQVVLDYGFPDRLTKCKISKPKLNTWQGAYKWI